jgi:hypothetical protein
VGKTYIARNTTLGDTFETNYPTTEGGTFAWVRQMTEASSTEVESTWTFPNGVTNQKIAYHVEIGKVNWADDRVGDADWVGRLRTGSSDSDVEYVEMRLQRVSADGNTIRNSNDDSFSGIPLTSNTNFDRPRTNVTSLDQPSGAASDDHLVVLFICDNTNTHGPDETVDIEQNTAVGTRLITPIFDPFVAPEVFWHGPIPQPLF